MSNALPVPGPNTNNVWYRVTDSDTVYIFVHGVLSDSRGCWQHGDPGEEGSAYWPALAAVDDRLGNPAIFLGGYYTAVDSGDFPISQCAAELLEGLTLKDTESRKPPMEWKNIVFICHSTGGIVVRYLLERFWDRFKDKYVGLLLLASPSLGSVWANVASAAARYYNQRQVQQLQWRGDAISDIHARFRDLANSQRHSNLFGMEACETKMVFRDKIPRYVRWAVPNRWKVVNTLSAGQHFGEVKSIPDTDHFSIVKPTGPGHPSHRFLVGFASEFASFCDRNSPGTPPPATINLPPMVPPAGIGVHPSRRPARAGTNFIPVFHDIFGRKNDIARVTEALASSPVVCILGMPGIGKSHLAAEVGGSLSAAGNMDHVIWVQDQDGIVHLANLLDRLAVCFDVEHATRLPLEAKRQVVLRVMAQARCLIIIDNFETIEDVEIARFASECPAPSRILVTSRERAIPSAVDIPIKKLVEEDSVKLMRYHLTRLDASLELDKAALSGLALAADGNPLALKWAIGQLVHSGLSIESTREYLASAKGDLFPGLFDRGWNGLSADSRLVLQTITAMAAPVTVAYISGAGDLNMSAVDEALAGLARSCLVDTDTQLLRADRLYSVHPLTRSFARAKCERDPQAAGLLWDRIAAYWLGFADANGGMDWNWEGYDRLAQHSENLLEVVERRAAEGKWEEVKEFHRNLKNPFSIRGLWFERVRIAECAIEAARATGDLSTEAWCLVYDVAYTHMKRKQLDRAREATIEAQIIFRALADDGNPDNLGEAACAHHLGKVSEMDGDLDAARSYYRESLDLYASDADYVYFLETELASLSFLEENYDTAKKIFSTALSYARGRPGKCEIIVARCHNYLGAIAEDRSDLVEAETHYRRGREAARGIGRADLMAETSFRLARLLADEGRTEESHQCAEDARSLYLQLGDEAGVENARAVIRRIGSE